jgi:hypothetical protein
MLRRKAMHVDYLYSRRRGCPGSDSILMFDRTSLVSESAHFKSESESKFEASNVEFGVEVS